MSKDDKILVNPEISDMLKKGEIRECQPYPNQFVSTLFSVGKKNRGNRDKLKNIEQVDPLSTFTDGRFTLARAHAATRGLHVQIKHEGCLLSGSLTQKLQRQSSFSMVGEVLRIPLSVFWLRVSPQQFLPKLQNCQNP